MKSKEARRLRVLLREVQAKIDLAIAELNEIIYEGEE